MTELNRQELMEMTETEMETAVPAIPATAANRLLWIMPIVGGVVILLDQVTKRMVEGVMPLFTTWAPWPSLAAFFRFTHVPNTGTAFGLFPDGSTFFAVMAVLVALAIVYYNYTLPDGQRLLRLALGMQLGGALGNLIDRFRLGHVTDFFDFGPWPIFNVADISIVAGAFLLAWLVWQETKEEQRQAAETAAASAPDYERPVPSQRLEDAEA